MALMLVTACTALPIKGHAAPAARQSRFRGPGSDSATSRMLMPVTL
jgi:hypothetical protein